MINIKSLLVLNTGEKYGLDVPQREIYAMIGSDVSIPCKFKPDGKEFQVSWKKKGEKSEFHLPEGDTNAFIYHPTDSWVNMKYKGRTELIGNNTEGNCSILIRDVQGNISDIYVRLITRKHNIQHSYFNVTVSILAINATGKNCNLKS